MKNIVFIFIILTFLGSGPAYAGGTMVTSDLWIGAIIHTEEKGAVEAVWQKGGDGVTQGGDGVIWGYFYANPDDVSWGSPQNPEVFVKIWFDRSGRLDVNFFHVSVPDIDVYSDYPYSGAANNYDRITLSERYIRHDYESIRPYAEEDDDGDSPTEESSALAADVPKIRARILTDEKGMIKAVWHKGGEDTTVGEHKVIWGYFHASPDDVNWGSKDNPDLFVKIWFDASGRTDVNFFHVSVPFIFVYSDSPNDTDDDQTDITSVHQRYYRHEYRTDTVCSVEEQNEFVYDLMRDIYFWSDEVPETDYAAYRSPEDLLNDLMFEESDKWSYIESQEDHYSYFQKGKYVGLGFFLKFDNNDNLRVRFVYQNSPGDTAGLVRGDKVLEINGKTPMEIYLHQLWGTIFGEDEPGVKVDFKIEDLNGIVRELTMEKDWVTVNTTMHYEIFESSGLKIGYLFFKAFIKNAESELDVVFSYFKQNRIDDLILDLRYNGGGLTSIAQLLASLIGGDRVDGEIFMKTVHNDKYSSRNDTTYFIKPKNALNLDRVVFITSTQSCSASEVVMNSLKPFIDVVSVGDITCGKPYGMYGWDFCDKFIAPVTFKSTNADNEDYGSGISPLCYSGDDLTRPLGDAQEDSLEAALHYITDGACINNSGRVGTRRAGNYQHKEIELRGLRREIGAF